MSEEFEEIEDVKELGFEEALERLEKINNKLERNKVPLERAIEIYQHGMELVGHCETKLEEAEGKIKKITEENDEIDLEK
ncbi:MAG: exodeoxyribonuclease VII small subunit [Candidatus Thermoplasmatota archaeon]|nr:exodeoxyribonuclease VII small subunit [Candidatus Thermoplasmatota archaeon]MBS3790700.1 exodeoxyribonuclease VII small subunit [Candidatus Thermoplasmatota archaeon]